MPNSTPLKVMAVVSLLVSGFSAGFTVASLQVGNQCKAALESVGRSCTDRVEGLKAVCLDELRKAHRDRCHEATAGEKGGRL